MVSSVNMYILTICLFVVQVHFCLLSTPLPLPCHCQAPAMFPLLNMIREQAAAALIYESGGRVIVMHFVAFVLSLGCLTFYPNPQHVSPDAEILTQMRLVRQIYEHTKRVILPLCGAYKLQLTAELTLSGLRHSSLPRLLT